MSDNQFEPTMPTELFEVEQTNKYLASENVRLSHEVEILSKALEIATEKLEKVSRYADNVEKDIVVPYRTVSAVTNEGADILTQTTNVAALMVASIRSFIR